MALLCLITLFWANILLLELSTEPVKTRQRAGITKREKLIAKILQSECIKFITIFFPIKLLKVNGFVCLLGSRINLV